MSKKGHIIPTFKNLPSLQAIGETMTSSNQYINNQLAKFMSSSHIITIIDSALVLVFAYNAFAALNALMIMQIKLVVAKNLPPRIIYT